MSEPLVTPTKAMVASVTEPFRTEVYKALVSRFLSDNGRIWSTAAVFVPVALGAFGVFASIKTPRWEHAALLGLASTILLLFWNLIADRHREFQDQSRIWLAVLEEAAGLPEGGTWQSASAQETSARELRRTLPPLVALIWIIVALATANGWFATEEPPNNNQMQRTRPAQAMQPRR